MKNIGIITNSYPFTLDDYHGIFIYEFAQELASRKGIKVFILTPELSKNAIPDQTMHTNVSINTFPLLKNIQNFSDIKPWKIKQLFALMKNGSKAAVNFVQENKINRLLAAWAFPSGFFAYKAFLKTSIPYDVWSLGSDINKFSKLPILHSIIRLILKKASIRYADGYSLQSYMEKTFHNPVKFLSTTRTFTGARCQIKKANGKSSFLFIGRLHKTKGPDLLIHALSDLQKKDHNFTVSLVGSGPMKKKLHKMIGSYGLTDRVKLLGQKKGHEIQKLLSQSDCLLIPSRADSIPVVLSEAIQQNIPVIAFDTGDTGRIISEYKIGLVSAKRSPISLASCMEEFINTPDKKAFQKNMKKAKELFNVKVNIDRYLEYLI